MATVAVETGLNPRDLIQDPEMLFTLWQVLQDRAEAMRKHRR